MQSVSLNFVKNTNRCSHCAAAEVSEKRFAFLKDQCNTRIKIKLIKKVLIHQYFHLRLR